MEFGLGQRQIGWHGSAFVAAGITTFSAAFCVRVVVYIVDKWEKHFPVALMAVLAERKSYTNYLPTKPY
ncbi:hypothetical protein HOY82DRAFT_672102 [Tuber indicum]|nr:hypothetical protein HOY82DRAFT_672102 [Tuber indicum]